jgi:type IX secretion system PorP/SprF family membrane protein
MKLFLLYIVLFFSVSIYAQDPHFSQFFSAPLNINPALTGDINSTTRVILNYRRQWSGLATPYTTEVLTCDTKFRLNQNSSNFFGGGIMFMGDQAMEGVFSSTYFSGNIAGHFFLDEDESQRLSCGFATMYGNRVIDYNSLNFSNQFVSGGFNTSLPSGEMGFTHMKPFTSVSAGMLYQYSSENTLIEAGIAAFHLNRPIQSTFQDPLQKLPIRYVMNASLDQQLTESTVLNVHALYQNQASSSYFSIGGILGYSLNDDNSAILNGGIWYRSNDAVYPYVGLNMKAFQFGLTYDVTVSQLKSAPQALSSWELSFVFRMTKNDDRPVKCPKSFWR